MTLHFKKGRSNTTHIEIGPSDPSSLLTEIVIIPRLFRIPDAAKYLSATIWFVKTLVREDKIPSFIQGKSRVIDRLELDKYADARNREAVAARRSIAERSVDVAA